MTQFPKGDNTFSQNLASAALLYTTAIDRAFILDQILFHCTANISETITITLDAAAGSGYDTILAEVVLVNEADYIFRPQGKAQFKKGDEIKVQCTNVGTTGTISGIIKTSEALV